MSDIVYVNEQYLTSEEARISIYDRGFLFADAVYEVAAVLDGKLIDGDAHMARLLRSLGELSIPLPVPVEELVAIQRALVSRNNLDEGLIYIQISRGVAKRDFAFPKSAQPTLVMFSMEKNIRSDPKAMSGLRVLTIPDLRWKRCDIKTVGLLAAVLAKETAVQSGLDDAWLVQDGFVTEGSSNNAFILTTDNHIITRQLGNEILPGITRRAVIDIARELGLEIEERAFAIEEAYEAAEAFITSASSFVCSVIEIDGKKIGSGAPGPVSKLLRQRYFEFAELETAT
jgi:D-alanine transaminase